MASIKALVFNDLAYPRYPNGSAGLTFQTGFLPIAEQLYSRGIVLYKLSRRRRSLIPSSNPSSLPTGQRWTLCTRDTHSDQFHSCLTSLHIRDS